MAIADPPVVRVVLERERETKRTWRYVEAGDAPLLGQVYLPKATLAEFGGPPAAIAITVEPA